MALGKYNPLKADSPEIVKTRFTKVEATNPLCPENLDLGFVCEENMKLLYKRICIYSLFFLPPPSVFSGQVLHDSGVFEYTWKELSIWLEHLDNTEEDKKEAVIQFLERVTTVQISWINNAENSINGNSLFCC